MKKDQIFYFVDTRNDAKSKQAFGIRNADVAKSWTRDFANGEGYFQPVEQEEASFQINRHDLQNENMNDLENQKAATDHNTKIVFDTDNPYKEMGKKELQDELTARKIEFKKNGPESTNEFYANMLSEDDEE